MTDDAEASNKPDSAEAAMNEVLAAEKAAEEAIDACEKEARASLHEATLRARRIADRTNERIALIQQRTRQQLQQFLRKAEREAGGAEQAHDAEDLRLAIVAGVANELAERLTAAGDTENTETD